MHPPPPPPARRRGARSRAPRPRGRAPPPAARSRGSAASDGASRRARAAKTRAGRIGRRSRSVYCTGRYNEGGAMTGQIEIPESFPRPGAVAGKRVVITGASRGLGALLAHAFSHAGAAVALVGRTEKDLKTVAGALPGPSLVLSGDVTDEDFNEGVADTAVTEWGGVEVWICNAGISPIVAGPRETDASVWRHVLEVNLTGAFLGARAATRVMREGGRLIFTGSVLGERPRAGLAAYSASKAGLTGMAKGLALDLAPSGITVNVVAPGWFDSPLAHGWKTNVELSDAITGHTAQGRWGAPADLTGAYLFLASDASAFVTGTVLNVDGGYLLV